MRLIRWARARAPNLVILVGLLATVGLNGGPASAQTGSGFVLNFSDYNNEPSVPITETTAVATFQVVADPKHPGGLRLDMILHNTSTPIPNTSGPGPTISNVGFNVNPDLTLSLTDVYLKDLDLPPGATVSLDKKPILDDVHRSIYGDFEWMINFKGFGLGAGGWATVSVGLLAPLPTEPIKAGDNSLGWSGVAHFQQTSTGPGVADSTWAGSHGSTPVTPEGSTGGLLAFALAPLLAAALLRKRGESAR